MKFQSADPTFLNVFRRKARPNASLVLSVKVDASEPEHCVRERHSEVAQGRIFAKVENHSEENLRLLHGENDLETGNILTAWYVDADAPLKALDQVQQFRNTLFKVWEFTEIPPHGVYTVSWPYRRDFTTVSVGPRAWSVTAPEREVILSLWWYGCWTAEVSLPPLSTAIGTEFV